MPVGGGAPETLTHPSGGEDGFGHYNPQFLPGGQDVLFRILPTNTLGFLSIQTGELRVETQESQFGLYAQTGHLLWGTADDDLRAASFDAARLEHVGASVSALENVFFERAAYSSWFALSEAGTLAYVPGSPARRSLVWMDREGNESNLVEELDDYRDVTLSPDGSKMAYRAHQVLWVWDLVRGTRTRFTAPATGDNSRPVWGPDGAEIFFASNRAGSVNIHAKRADGVGEARQLTSALELQRPLSFTPDGRVLAIQKSHLESVMDILTMSMDPEGEPEPFIVTPANERAARFSPDGRFVAYVSDESGRDEVYVQPYPGPGGKIAISTGGGNGPVWSADGNELFYRRAKDFMVVDVDVDVEIEGAFSPGAPRRLFSGPYLSSDMSVHRVAQYDVSRDGEKFLMIRREPASIPTQINLITHWHQELERLVPTK